MSVRQASVMRSATLVTVSVVIPLQPALQQYTAKSCCIRQYSGLAVSRAHCGAIQLYSAMQHAAIHRSTVYNTLQSFSEEAMN